MNTSGFTARAKKKTFTLYLFKVRRLRTTFGVTDFHNQRAVT